MTRLVCLDCSGSDGSNSVDTVDLCRNCIDIEFTRAADGKVHLTSHSLVQIRKPTPNRRIYDLVNRATSVLQNLQFEGSSPDDCILSPGQGDAANVPI